MKAYEARALLFQRKLQGKPVEFSIPGVPELDGKLYMLELTARDTRIISKMSKNADGEMDQIASQAAVVCRGLVMADTKERVFADLDIDMIAGNDEPDEGKPIDGFGTFVLKLLGDEISKLSGFDPDAVEQAKESFLQAHAIDSTSSSIANSEQPVAV
jgi:hypothetical protein